MKRHLTFIPLLLVAVLLIPLPASAQNALAAFSDEYQVAPADEAAMTLATSAPDGLSVLGGQLFRDQASSPLNEADALPNNSAEALASRRRWKTFSRNIERALASGHEGLQTSAMRHVIYYGDNVKIGEEAVFDVMRLYRNHENERVRRMAIVTLSQTNSRWAMRFLERAVRFEKSPALKHTIQAVLAENNQSRSAS